ncbi:MAG TPA: hypothetical protein VGL86_06215 [Polyangia bacterium]|jgi:hypothetical protein
MLALGACHPAPRPTPILPARLGWITWSDVNELVYCNQRLDDAGNRVGVLGPCWHMTVGEPAKKMLSWLNAGRPDSTPPNATPWERCSVELRGGTAILHTPTETQTLASDANGRVELSFSPEGKWMAIVHVALSGGEGERIVEVSAVDVRPIPACR